MLAVLFFHKPTLILTNPTFFTRIGSEFIRIFWLDNVLPDSRLSVINLPILARKAGFVKIRAALHSDFGRS